MVLDTDNPDGRSVATMVSSRGRRVNLRCPYGAPGFRLWIRETWAEVQGAPFADGDGEVVALYRCDYFGEDSPKWRPSIHMPRRYARTLVEVTKVAVERLHAIRPDGARAEGVPDDGWCKTDYPEFAVASLPGFYEYHGRDGIVMSNFASLWQTINGAGSWDRNPWVWVIGYKLLNSGA